MNVLEERQRLINLLLSKRREILQLKDDLMPCLRLKTMASDETEVEDIEDIADALAVFLGSGEEVSETVYAFNHRINNEKRIEKSHPG